MSTPSQPAVGAKRWCWQNIERDLRLAAGVVLMLFVTTHLLNHAVGIFGVPAMTAIQDWRVAIWRSLPGSALLYGAFAIHVVLALKRLLKRRTWRMPPIEAVQLGFALAIPYFLAPHFIGTRYVATAADVDTSYLNVLRNLWPDLAIFQTTLVVIVWVHGVIGIYAALRHRPWFIRRRMDFFILATLIPALALAGFVSAGREAVASLAPPRDLTDAEIMAFNLASGDGSFLMYGVMALLALVFAAREILKRFRPRVFVRYVGQGLTSSPTGLTLLEISRLHGIDHPSICGGRARCSRCRVLIESGGDSLPPPTGPELLLLDRIRAPRSVRLGCQIRPVKPLSVRILLPAHYDSVEEIDIESDAALDWGAEHEVGVLFADIRGFSTMARYQLPSDLVAVLNRVIADMRHAIETRGGQVMLVPTDGVFAVFQVERSVRRSAISALRAAMDILAAVDANNKELSSALPQPIRVGIGVHVGPVVLARIGQTASRQQTVAIGDTVVIASRLEEATKEIAADMLVSADAFKAIGVTPHKPAREFFYKNGSAAVEAYAFADREDARTLLRRSWRKQQRLEPAE